jgi:hypothetical protein
LIRVRRFYDIHVELPQVGREVLYILSSSGDHSGIIAHCAPGENLHGIHSRFKDTIDKFILAGVKPARILQMLRRDCNDDPNVIELLPTAKQISTV